MSNASRDGPNGCWLNDPRPEKPERYSGPRSAAKDGYTASDRRARHDTAGNIVSRERAERIESFHEEMSNMGGSPYSLYDD